MIVDGVEYDDEEWRIARVSSVRRMGEEHRICTLHHGEMRENHYVCLDCMTVYFDGCSRVEESPVWISGEIPIDEKFLDRLVELGIQHAEDLEQFGHFLKKVVLAHGLSYEVPDLARLREGMRENDSGGFSWGERH